MANYSRRLKGLYTYLTGGYKALSNWPSFFLDLVMMGAGQKTKTEAYVLRDGTRIHLHRDSKRLNYVFFTVFIKGEYNRLKNFEIKEDDVVIDIGAHLGFFTIKAARKAVKGRVYAFEPFTMHYNLLKKNIDENRISNVRYFKEAVADKAGELSFYYTIEGDPGDTSLYKTNDGSKTYEEKVKSISFDEFFEREKLQVCNFLKMDCEGAEYSILMNASDSTMSKIKRIAMEWHRFTPDHNPEKLAEFLRSKGFKLVEETPYDQQTGFIFAHR